MQCLCQHVGAIKEAAFSHFYNKRAIRIGALVTTLVQLLFDPIFPKVQHQTTQNTLPYLMSA